MPELPHCLSGLFPSLAPLVVFFKQADSAGWRFYSWCVVCPRNLGAPPPTPAAVHCKLTLRPEGLRASRGQSQGLGNHSAEISCHGSIADVNSSLNASWSVWWHRYCWVGRICCSPCPSALPIKSFWPSCLMNFSSPSSLSNVCLFITWFAGPRSMTRGCGVGCWERRRRPERGTRGWEPKLSHPQLNQSAFLIKIKTRMETGLPCSMMTTSCTCCSWSVYCFSRLRLGRC